MIIVMAMMAAISVNAQSDNYSKWSMKGRVGGNLATITDAEDTKMKLDVTAGFGVDYRISKNFALALEVNHDGCISTQVLQEFCNTMYKKTRRTKEEIDTMLDGFRELLETDVTIDLVRHALQVKEEYGIQYYDALVVSAAEKLGCQEIISEDLSDGQIYRGMRAVNPFK